VISLANLIRRAVPALLAHGASDTLIPGLTTEQSHDAIRFIPLAFGRHLLRGTGVKLPDTIIRVFEGREEEVALQDEQFFRGASFLAPTLAQELGGDAFAVIALQSAEVRAVNEALHAGANPHALVAAPPRIECTFPRRPPEPWWKIWA
jgi:hypothetical protein